jgi:hypothetical protein
VGILTVIYHVPPTDAAAIALVDRSISVLSIILLGGLLYLVSPKVRGTGGARVVGEVASETASESAGPGQYE